MPSELPTPNPDHARWFTDEVQPHEESLRNYLKHSFPTVRDVDDVVQESLTRVWFARARQPIDSARAFLFKVARHMAIDVARRDKISPVDSVRDLDGLLVIANEPDVIDAVSTQEKARLLAQAIDTLPARCREIVILRKLQAVPQREVAARLGISEKTVEAQLARGLKRCEAFLRRKGVHHYYTDDE